MKRFLKWFLGILLFLVLAGAFAWFGFLKPAPPPISDKDRAKVTVMPLPSKLELGRKRFLIDGSFDVQFAKIETPRLQRATARFSACLENRLGNPLGTEKTKTLLLNCQQEGHKYPHAREDESYTLTVDRNKIEISSPTEWGILHGLETLLQLATQDNGVWYFPEVHVTDKPRYPWRGLMIDVSRHWIPKEIILKNLDAMAAVKMNVLHLHLTDHQGFRIESMIYPKLHGMGSNGHFFSQKDIKEIVDYAADLGIRVIPEFDVPGHATSWFVGHPELASQPGPYKLQTDFGVGGAVMNPEQEEVYTFLDAFFGEMATLFPDDYVHIGGDEVDTSDWENNTGIQAFMRKERLEDYHALQAHFNTRVRTIIEGHGKKMMGWDEILYKDFKGEGLLVQSWRSHKSLWDAIRKGSTGILSFGYYLDHKQTAAFHYGMDPEVIKGGITIDIDPTQWESWQLQMSLGDHEMEGNLYLFGTGQNRKGIVQMMGNTHDFENATLVGESLQFSHEAQFGELNYMLNLQGDSIFGETKISVFTVNVSGKKSGGSDIDGGSPLPKFEKIAPLTELEAQNIWGGEACMWTEMANEHTIESRIWPRAGAIAEKLWSPKVLTDDVKDMYRRLMAFDDYLEVLQVQHKNASKKIIESIVSEEYRDALTVLVDVLQEDKLFNRMTIYDTLPNVNTPLNRIVDAARPESHVAYQFGKNVDAWLETSDETLKSKLLEQLERWQANHEKLAGAFEEIERLKEVEPHSRHLSQLAIWGLNALEKPLDSKLETQQDSLFALAQKAYGGTLMPVVNSFQKLLRNGNHQ